MEPTPITADFQAMIQDGDGNALTPKFSDYFLEIQSPSTSGRVGKEQGLAQTAHYVLPDDGKLRLKLMPSAVYLPFGRYTVKYFHKDDIDIPIQVQYWLVPEAPLPSTYGLEAPSPEVPVALPNNFYAIRSVRYNHATVSGSSYLVEYNQQQWQFQFTAGATDIPPENALFYITYQPTVTLDQVLDHSIANNPYYRY